MTKYYTIVLPSGLQGGRYYKTAAEAWAAADRRNAIMGRALWRVKAVYSSDPYADDDRPYCARK